jgi:hypothetical protein
VEHFLNKLKSLKVGRFEKKYNLMYENEEIKEE